MDLATDEPDFAFFTEFQYQVWPRQVMFAAIRPLDH
jgi:hypothetical protein